MKVKYIGFGGSFIEYPCYEDKSGRIYFDINDGRGDLRLYTGAYKDEDEFIEGEPCGSISVQIECDNPFKRHSRERDYRFLDRLRMDCEYFLGYGCGYEGHLYYKEVNEHCDKMMKIYESFSDEDKPVWISKSDIENYKTKMLEKRKEVKS